MDNINENGVQEPINLVKDIPKDRETAIIDLVTLQRLAHNLAAGKIDEIIGDFIRKLSDSIDYESGSLLEMKEYLALLDNESAFHKTVITIIEYENYRKEQDELCEAMHKDGKT